MINSLMDPTRTQVKTMGLTTTAILHVKTARTMVSTTKTTNLTLLKTRPLEAERKMPLADSMKTTTYWPWKKRWVLVPRKMLQLRLQLKSFSPSTTMKMQKTRAPSISNKFSRLILP